ncbi:6-pyruvoyl trahydropterin synthase family protein [Pseudokineococcus sp. 1T1Z-3]|uniref:6-pyruvoyl trahydropterin synthase family protein n=1 Tax=Pseudokineococcus sp. 1T1Z-3 TaxID=3132745 RepID=UPI0030ADDAAF
MSAADARAERPADPARTPAMTFCVTVEDHVMVAHSLPHPAFGPAQRTHGATFDVAATFWREGLDETGVVLDIGAASAALRAVLADLDYRDLDEHPAFEGLLSTTEVVARHVAEQLLAAPALAEHLAALARLDVVLRENPRASAGVSVDLGARAEGRA